MADADDLLTQWADPVLGDLVWEGNGWVGTVEIGGRSVRLWLDADRKNPTREDQIAVIESSRSLLEGVRRVEPEFHLRLVRDIADEVGSQDSKEAAAEALAQADELAAAMELDEVALYGGGALHYHDSSGKFFPRKNHSQPISRQT